jgi:hexosaminidase
MNRVSALCVLSASLMIGGCNDDAPKSPTKEQTVAASVSQLSPQEHFDAVANSLIVRYKHLTNIPSKHCKTETTDNPCFQVELSITAPQVMQVNNWSIYYSQIAPVSSFVSDTLSIKHLNGDLHQISPIGIGHFSAGETKKLVFNALYWSVSEFDAIPNYILYKEGLKPRVITSTKSVIDKETLLETLPFVASYTNQEQQLKRTAADKTVRATSKVLFNKNSSMGVSHRSIATSIIPTPQHVKNPLIAGALDISKGLNIGFNGLDKDLLNNVVDRLALLGVQTSHQGTSVNLIVDSSISNVKGSYQLAVTTSGIDIIGGDITGVYYGLTSLASLITVGESTVPYVSIIDKPHYQYRGMHVDVARNFLSKAFIIKLMDQMAAYKLNKLHLHLADDEGWRLEIPWLPELTEISSKRCLDFKESKCLIPQLGAGVDPSSKVNGFYSVNDYQEILKAATARHIQVIPSLDMPGHSRSSVTAMNARYKHYMAKGQPDKAKQFLLYDLEDRTQYSSVQFYNDNTMNVCMESSYAFVDKVMDEVKRMHQEAGHPLTRYHIGADETAGAWVESPSCKAFLANNNQGIKSPDQLGGYFIERVAQILKDKDIEVAGWNDGLMHTNVDRMPKVVQANAWGSLYDNGHKVAHQMMNQGWQVVLSAPDVLYFDFPYEADPKEHGYYWASREINTRKIFELMPDNLPAHAEIWKDRMNTPFSATDTHETVLTGNNTLSGIQGQLWTESTRTQETAEYKVFPRLLALAERAWHSATWQVPYQTKGATYNDSTNFFTPELQRQRDEKWQQFSKTISLKEMPKLDLSGVIYRIPTVGAVIKDGILEANSIFPQLPIQYRSNGGVWHDYQSATAVTGEIEVRGLSADRSRKGRILMVK